MSLFCFPVSWPLGRPAAKTKAMAELGAGTSYMAALPRATMKIQSVARMISIQEMMGTLIKKSNREY